MQANGPPPHGTRLRNESATPRMLFPLIRHLSERATPLLARLPFTPNQITFASLFVGLAGAACYLEGSRGWGIAGGVLILISYVLDNCDGEIARLRNMQSQFGASLDNAADGLIHAALFLALGWAAERAFDAGLWFWLGAAAAAGCMINYAIVQIPVWLRGAGTAANTHHAFTPPPKTPKDLLVYVFREIFRADFCFVLLALSAFDLAWVLLPLSAVGAQVYWLMVFVKGARNYRV